MTSSDGRAQVSGQAQVYGQARVRGQARIAPRCRVGRRANQWRRSRPLGRSHWRCGMTDYDDEGYLTDMYGHQIGVCNACGEEAEADTECCEDGEVVPARDVDGAP